VGASFIGGMIGGYFGVKHVLCLDLHDPHIKHYFDGSDADDVTAIYLIIDFLKKEVVSDSDDWMVVFADAGSAKRYEEVGHLLGLPSAYIDKKRPKDDDNINISKVAGNVKNKRCILIDDEILTGGTTTKGADYLFNEGALSVSVAAIHAVMRAKGHKENWVAKRLEKSRIERFIITDSIPIGKKIEETSKFTVLRVGLLVAEAVKRLIMSESLTEMRGLDKVHLYNKD
jgi:ribose-phosphate pyrophosphokinase